MRDIIAIDDDADSLVVKGISKQERPKEKTIQQSLDRYCIEKENS